MSNLLIIENGLVPIYQSDKGTNLVNARELHEFLEVNSKFADWIKNRIEKYEFIENQDFLTVSKNLENGGRSIDYIFKLEPAKEIAMVENNEKGKEIRRYFIKVEEKFRQQPMTPQVLIATALIEAQKLIESKDEVIALMKPKADFFDAVANSKDAIEMSQAAKVLNYGKGRNVLFKILRTEKILRDNNEPYQEFIDRGYFRLLEQKYTKPDGTTCINTKTLVYQKGLSFIKKVLDRQKAISA
jgi:anti-repressor protein